MTKKEYGGFSSGLLSLTILLIVLTLFKIINTGQAIEIMILFALVLVTFIYAKRTSEIAKAAKKQAEEMTEQRVIASRPVIIQKAVPVEVIGTGFSDEFEIYNAGNGPAIELEILLLDKDRKLLQSERKTFLRTGEPPITFHPHNLVSHVNSDCYLLCRYQSIQSRGTKPSWYQTWLPFKPVKSQSRDYIYVQSGALEFEEVFEKKSY